MTELRKSTEQIVKMVNSGIDIEEAYRLVKPGKKLNPAIKRDMLAKAASYSLVDPKRVKKAAKTLDKILNGEWLDKEQTIKPNASTIIKAVEMIKDREEPIVNINHNLNVSIDVSPVDLSKYRNRTINPLVDNSVD